MEDKNIFSLQCPVCSKKWESVEDFISDPETKIVGYQVNFDNLKLGFLLFDHVCGTTISLQVEEVKHLYDGPIYIERKTLGEECPTYCIKQSELRPCPAKCECAWVREVISILEKYPKRK